MIISHTYKFAIVTPPKTASTTLHEWLIAPPFCDHHYPPPSKRKEQHDTPDGLDDHYTVAVAWRDPRDREVSLWAHSQSATSRRHDRTPETHLRRVCPRLPTRGHSVLLGLTSLVDPPPAPCGLRDPAGQPPSRRNQLPTDPRSHHRRPHAASDAATEHHTTPPMASALHTRAGANRPRTICRGPPLEIRSAIPLTIIVAITLRRDERQ